MEIPIPIVPQIIPILSVATFNLEGSKDQEYIEKIANTAKDQGIDIMAVQGCHKFNTEILLRSFKQNGYQYTRFDQMHTRTLGEIMFYRSGIQIKKKEYSNFSNTAQSRGMSKYKVSVTPDQEVWVVSSELEDGGSGNGNRRLQITEIDNALSSSSIPVIFVGDTKIPSWQDLGAPPGWLDAWREKGTADNEHTNYQDRSDRIWYRSLACIKYDLLCGDEDRKGCMAVFENL